MHAAKWLLASVLVAATALAGCDRNPSAEEYGQVLYEIPDIPGAEEPITIPELEDVPRPDPSEFPF